MYKRQPVTSVESAPQPGVQPEFLTQACAGGAHHGAFARQVQAEIGQQPVESKQGHAPPVTVRHGLHEVEGGIAVRTEQPLRENDARGAAVALDFTVIAVDLQAPDDAIGLRLGDGVMQRGEHLVQQTGWFSVDAQPDVPVGIGIADEEPVVHGSVGQATAQQRPDDPPQHRVRRGNTGVQLGVEPFRARMEASAYRADKQYGRRRWWWRRWGVRGDLRSQEREHKFMHEPSFGPRDEHIVQAVEQLHQRHTSPVLQQRREHLHGHHILQIDGQEVVTIRDGDPARQAQRLTQALHRGVEAPVMRFAQVTQLLRRYVPP